MNVHLDEHIGVISMPGSRAPAVYTLSPVQESGRRRLLSVALLGGARVSITPAVREAVIEASKKRGIDLEPR